MLLPPRLKKGDTIGVFASSSSIISCGNETIDRGYAFLKAKGFQVREGSSCRKTDGHSAGTIDERLKDIHDYFADDSVSALMAFWGGFNTNELLDRLDFDLIRKHPKILIGYSDTTALTSTITQKTGLVTFSGPGVISFAKPQPFDYTWNNFDAMCISPTPWHELMASSEYADDAYFLRKDNDHRILKPSPDWGIFRSGQAEGKILAGNLQTLLILGGTTYQPDYKDHVLFIEEDESTTPAMVDRFFMQARQTHIFDKISGLVIGRFAESCGFGPDDKLEWILEKALKGHRFPVITDVDFGHTDPLCTIPNGGLCRIDADKRSISFAQAVT